MTIDEAGSAQVFTTAAASFDPAGGGATVDCRTDDCAFVAFDPDGAVVAHWPTLAFSGPTTVTLSPSSGLLEGADMTLAVDNLAPNSPYGVSQCVGQVCSDAQTLSTGADGVLHATLTASQQVDSGTGSAAYCRTDCDVLVSDIIFGRAWRASYSMASGTLAASPDEGLVDGESVQVTGTDLMPTYDGPPLWIFPTGGWALTQCDTTIVDDATLAGMLTHCATAPTTRAVDVAGSTLDTTLTARSTITRILGGTTDCAASPGACVVGLVRLEQDGSVSTHLTPVAFG